MRIANVLTFLPLRGGHCGPRYREDYDEAHVASRLRRCMGAGEKERSLGDSNLLRNRMDCSSSECNPIASAITTKKVNAPRRSTPTRLVCNAARHRTPGIRWGQH